MHGLYRALTAKRLHPMAEPTSASPPASHPQGLEDLMPHEPMEGVDESTWMDVIQKMDEVYSQLIHDEIELEKKNTELELSQQFIFSVLSAMSDVLLVCNERGVIEETNAALCELAGQTDAELRGTSFYDLLADPQSVERARSVLENTDPPRRGEGLELILLDAQRQSVPVDANCTPRVAAGGRSNNYCIPKKWPPWADWWPVSRTSSTTPSALCWATCMH